MKIHRNEYVTKIVPEDDMVLTDFIDGETDISKWFWSTEMYVSLDTTDEYIVSTIFEINKTRADELDIELNQFNESDPLNITKFSHE